MSSLIDQYFESLKDLPATFTKTLKDIGKKDLAVQKLSYEADGKFKYLVRFWKTLSEKERADAYRDIMNLFNEIEQLSDEKICLASDNYELVDKHIRRLDSDAAKLRATMNKKFMETARSVEAQKRAAAEAAENSLARKKKRSDKKTPKTQLAVQSDVGSPTAQFQSFLDSAPVVEMPVDPNEPTYCICHQVSFGQMIMCDNKHCPIEWFHFQCVGLTTSPKGKWYCRACSELRRKKQGSSRIRK
ncbi:hypothetical protein AB6A40_003727 [Gnathostoma spinigerum]|uniref:Inhibitor of growth protein n=1 Tax=Gnathostoma spinigerum TaxID=75299 RepID=A0ABD6EAE2_9BILA